MSPNYPPRQDSCAIRRLSPNSAVIIAGHSEPFVIHGPMLAKSLKFMPLASKHDEVRMSDISAQCTRTYRHLHSLREGDKFRRWSRYTSPTDAIAPRALRLELHLEMLLNS